MSGNEFIALIHMIIKKSREEEKRLLSSQIEGMLFSNRMHVGSYRQNIRLTLYSLLSLVVTGKVKEARNTSFTEKVISAI